MNNPALNHEHHHSGFVFNNIFRTDPTRTLMLRKRFASDMNQRFMKLKNDIRTSIVDNDCFGLKQTPRKLKLMTPIEKDYFKFAKNDKKLSGFMVWLQEQEQDGILEIIHRPAMHPGIEEAWTDIYIQTAYQKGILRAREELRNQGINVPPIEQMPGGMSSVFNAPIHVDRVGLLYARAFSELEGITRAMDQQISRELAQGIAEGRNPREIARLLNNRVDKIGMTRAKMLARTEIIRAHHQATIAEYKQFGVEGVTVKAEWVTAGYGVCDKCKDFEGRTFTLKQIEPMIPAHPNCRCVAIPILGEQKKIKTQEQKSVIIETKVEPHPIQLRIVDGSLYANDSGDGIFHHLGRIKGEPGVDGKDGESIKGDKGDKGQDGIGITDVKIIDNILHIKKTDGEVLRLGNVKGDKGERGDAGVKGDRGDRGPRGLDGVGIVGARGLDGRDGKDGKDGRDGKDGKPGKDGKDGVDGAIGAMPDHEIDLAGGRFRFRKPDGAWGKWIRIPRGGGGADDWFYKRVSKNWQFKTIGNRLYAQRKVNGVWTNEGFFGPIA